MFLENMWMSVFQLIRRKMRKIPFTKYFLGLVTVFTTIVALPLLRIGLKGNGPQSNTAEIAIWLAVAGSGIAIILYPWWLATSSSPMYYDRLQKYGKGIAAISITLVILRSALAPAEPFRYDNPESTTIVFRVISTMWWATAIFGFLILLPILIRREKIFRGNKLILFGLLLPYTILMFAGIVVNEWTGSGEVTAYSPLVLLALFGLVAIVEALLPSREVSHKSHFDEAYIMVAGFLPFWLASVLGRSLLTLMSKAGPLGTLFIYSSWKILIYIFEVLSAAVGRKASRTADESVFSFCAVYTGATYAEFIFLSVTFNSLKFWALLTLEVAIIVIWQGGMMINIQDWVLEYLSSEYSLFRLIKIILLNLVGEMPYELAQHVSRCRPSNAPPDIQMALIRSRAMVVQGVWSVNDIKMASEFQALACAVTAVAGDMLYAHFNVGNDFLPESVQTKRELLCIYSVNLLGLLVAQAVARWQLKKKVYLLKRDIPKVVAAVIDIAKSGKSSFINDGTCDHPATSHDTSAASTPIEMVTRLRSSAFAGGVQGYLSAPIFGGSFRRMSEQTDPDDETDQAMTDLETILQLSSTYSSVPPADVSRTRGSSVVGKLLSRRSSAIFEELPEDISEADPDQDWGDVVDVREVDCFSRPGSCRGPIALPESLMQGYLRKVCRDGTRTQRRYFVCAKDKLLYFADKQDISHVSNIKGTINLSNILSVDLSTNDPCLIKISEKDRIYDLYGYTPSETQAWQSELLDAIKNLRSADTRSHSDATVHLEEGRGNAARLNGHPKRRQSLVTTPTNFLGRVGANRTRRASLNIQAPVTAATATTLREKKGFLRRRNVLYWQERWFELLLPGELAWYPPEVGYERQNANGIISMIDVLSVSRSIDDPCCIDIDVKGFTHEIQADSEGLATEWYEALISWVRQAAIDAENKHSKRRSSLIINDTQNGNLQRPTFPVIDGTYRTMEAEDMLCDIIPVVSGKQFQMRGPLEKRQLNTGNWHGRWCEVAVPGVFSYSRSRPPELGAAQESTREIPIEKVTSVENSAEDKCCFIVRTQDRSYEFRASSNIEAAKWIQCVCGWMKHLTNVVDDSYLFDSQTRYRRSDTLKSTVSENSTMKKSSVVVLREKASVLRKKGGIWGNTWQSRYVTIRRPGVLMWFLDREEELLGRPRGQVVINDVLSVEAGSAGGPHFDVCVKGRSYEFCAATDAECVEWIDVISSWAKFSDLKASGLPAPMIESDDLPKHGLSNAGLSREEQHVVEHKAFRGARYKEHNDDVMRSMENRDENAPVTSPIHSGGVRGDRTAAKNESIVLGDVGDPRSESVVREVADVDNCSSTDSSDEESAKGNEEEAGMSTRNISDMTLPLCYSPKRQKTKFRLSFSDPQSSADGVVTSAAAPPSMSVRQIVILRRSSKLPKAWIDCDVDQSDDSDEAETVIKSDLPTSPILTRPRRASDIADTVFIRLNSQSDDDDFVNKLKTNSYRDLSEEYWLRHKWYLAMVVCFVTLQVLRVTSFILRELESGF